ncbi:hypothetical protein [Bradyrhizobium sp. AZCC 1693]|uniref:hypothetical protein n=1 Tax=Bradyrhizobium sp. AZCC 1693 TaxID=3117029 RepID=UPI002FF39B54
MVVWGAILPEITYGNDYREIHRVNGTMINESKLAADFLTKQGYKKFVVVHDTTDYGKGQNKYFSEYLKPTVARSLRRSRSAPTSRISPRSSPRSRSSSRTSS